MSADQDDLPPAVSKRLDIPSVTNFVDQMMERIHESVVLNMADHQQRNHLRSWMTGVLNEFMSQAVFAFEKGADRGIQQVAQLMRDPDYYRTASERRRRYRDRMRQSMAESDARSQQWREAKAREMKEMVDEGKLKLFHGQMLDVEALPDDDKGPH